MHPCLAKVFQVDAPSSSKVAPPLPTTTSTSEKVAHWYDPAHKALVRHGKSAGELEIAHMAPGAGGFCTATFGGGEPLATEIPNVLLKQPKIPKKSAAKAKQSFKRPAAVKPAIPAEPEACPTPLRRTASFLVLFYFFALSYFIFFSMFGCLSFPCLGYSLGQTALDTENSMFICELFWTLGSSTQVQQDARCTTRTVANVLSGEHMAQEPKCFNLVVQHMTKMF